MFSELPAIARSVLTRSGGLYLSAFVAAIIAIAAFFVVSYAATFVDRRGIAEKLEATNARGKFAQTWAGYPRAFRLPTRNPGATRRSHHSGLPAVHRRA